MLLKKVCLQYFIIKLILLCIIVYVNVYYCKKKLLAIINSFTYIYFLAILVLSNGFSIFLSIFCFCCCAWLQVFISSLLSLLLSFILRFMI